MKTRLIRIENNLYTDVMGRCHHLDLCLRENFFLLSNCRNKYIKLFNSNKNTNRHYFDDMLSEYPYEYDSEGNFDYFIHVYEGNYKVDDKYRFVKFGGMEFI